MAAEGWECAMRRQGYRPWSDEYIPYSEDAVRQANLLIASLGQRLEVVDGGPGRGIWFRIVGAPPPE